MRIRVKPTIFLIGFLFCLLGGTSYAGVREKTIPVSPNDRVEVKNPNGRITLRAQETESHEITIKLANQSQNLENLVITSTDKGRIKIEILPSEDRVDLELAAPLYLRLKLESTDGQITVSGKFTNVTAESDTGTIYADTAPDGLRYKFLWTASYPRYVSEVEVSPIEEKSAGKHVIEGTFPFGEGAADTDSKSAFREIYLRTARGIVLFNVDPSLVPNDLLPKKLTKAAQAIIQSGDSQLVNAIRRAAPDLFGDYASTLPPHRAQPELSITPLKKQVSGGIRKVTVQVTDAGNRAFAGLSANDFVVTERGEEREILEFRQSTAPFNLVLLVDVSGSVENYVDFIRKAARAFVNTVDPVDRVSIILFSDDIQPLSGFTADKDVLSASLDTFDAGGSTTLYDALGYALTESIRPLKGERTAIVILSDGDDNRSILPFESLIGSLQESGALVYPMYVPSSLIAASGDFGGEIAPDPLRERFITGNLSSKAQDEGERLAKISGGVYYPISRLSELQKAYDDIVVQLRTAYTITYRSTGKDDTGERASPRLRVKVMKENAFVRIGNVVAVGDK